MPESNCPLVERIARVLAGAALSSNADGGHAGKSITVYKFRTMRPIEIEDEREAAITKDDIS